MLSISPSGRSQAGPNLSLVLTYNYRIKSHLHNYKKIGYGIIGWMYSAFSIQDRAFSIDCCTSLLPCDSDRKATTNEVININFALSKSDSPNDMHPFAVNFATSSSTNILTLFKRIINRTTIDTVNSMRWIFSIDKSQYPSVLWFASKRAIISSLPAWKSKCKARIEN